VRPCSSQRCSSPGGSSSAAERRPWIVHRPRQARSRRRRRLAWSSTSSARFGRPGLYRLVHGARIADAVRRAGGATRRADLSLVNLAAQVSDGSQVVVPRREVVESGAASESGESGVGGAPGGTVHLNTATLDELDALPGVGPVTAQKILDYREQHGAFSSIDDLDAIPGIGPARLEQLRELVAP
jgi:competence protein ComEA